MIAREDYLSEQLAQHREKTDTVVAESWELDEPDDRQVIWSQIVREFAAACVAERDRLAREAGAGGGNPAIQEAIEELERLRLFALGEGYTMRYDALAALCTAWPDDPRASAGEPVAWLVEGHQSDGTPLGEKPWRAIVLTIDEAEQVAHDVAGGYVPLYRAAPSRAGGVEIREAVREALTRLIVQAGRLTWGPYDVLGHVEQFRDREYPILPTPGATP
jgi:hypothetical protein